MPKEDGKWNVGIEFQLTTIAYAAACLSENEDVEDFEIYTNHDDVPGFDDIIIKVKYKAEPKPFVYLGQIKHVTNKIDLKRKKHSPNYYADFIKKITFDKEQNRFLKGLFQDIPDANIEYWYYSNSFFRDPLTQPIELDDGVVYDIVPATTNKSIFPTKNTTDCYKLNPMDPNQYSPVLDQFRFVLNQPDYHEIPQCIVNRNTDMFSIDTASKIISYVQTYFRKPTNKMLTKQVFETELLKLCISPFVVSPTAAFQIDPQLANMWNELILQYDITVIDNTSKEMEPYIFGCVWQKLNDLYDCDFDWNKCITDFGKKKIAIDKDKFTALTKAKEFRYWLLIPDTVDTLLVEMWKCDYLPLVLKSDTKSSILNKYKHLSKKIIVLDNNGKIYDEVSLLNVKVFANAAVIHEVELGKEFLKKLFISLQGREPVDMFSIVNGDTDLMKELKCCHILHLIKKREICFDKINSVAPDDSNAINQINVNNSDAAERVTNNTFDSRRFTVDENGDDLYFQNNHVVPIIGKKFERSKKYISRCLRKPTLEESIFNSKEKVICFLTGDLDSSLWIKRNGIKIIHGPVDHIVSKIKAQVEKKEHAFVETNDGDIEVLWSKVSPKNHSLLHIHVENGAMLLSKYQNCKNIGTYISYKGSIFDEQSFVEETSVGITLITGNPGTGKSTLLRSLFNSCDKYSYALLCDLNDYKQDIWERNTNLFSDPIHFILEREAMQSTLSNNRYSLCHRYLRFVHKFLERTSEIILFVDSFDEILPTCQEHVLDFIRVLSKKPNVRLIVASRLVMADVLINTLQVKPMKMETLNADNIKEYINNTKLTEYQSNQIPPEFRDSPMYLNFLISLITDNALPTTITISTLYNAIIEQHIKRYYEKRVDFYGPKQYKSVRKELLQIHKSLALINVCDYRTVQNLKLDYKQLMEDCTDTDKVKLGFILRFNVDRPVFIHQTFAEFFVAEWLIENSEEDNGKNVYKMLFDTRQVHIRLLLDEILCENLTLHKAVLAGDLSLVERLCSESDDYLKEVDKLNRTALHLASSYCLNPLHKFTWVDKSEFPILDAIVRHMKTNGLDFSCRDSITKWTWNEYLKLYLFTFNFEYLLSDFPVTLGMYYACQDEIEEGINWILEYGRDTAFDAALPLLKRRICLLPKYFFYLSLTFLSCKKLNLLCELIELENYDNPQFSILNDACKKLSCDFEVSACTNLKINEGFTAMHIACMYGNVDVVKELLNLGAEVNAVDVFKLKPLHYAVLRASTEIVTYLVKHTTLNYEAAEISSIFEEKKEILRSRMFDFLERILQPYLHISIDNDYMQIARILLENGFDINQRNNRGDTALHIPTQYRFEENDCLRQVSFLLKYNIDCNLQNNMGITALHVACENNLLNVAKILIKHGAKIELRNTFDFTCFDLAVQRGRLEIVEWFLSTNEASNFEDKYSKNVLHFSVSTNSDKRNDVTKALLEAGVPVNNTDKYGDTVLHFAAAPYLSCISPITRYDLVNILIKGGVNINHQNETGNTALHKAVIHANDDIVNLLSANGADVNIENKSGNTPLDCVVSHMSEPSEDNKKYDIIRALVKAGGNINHKNKYGDTALHTASRMRNTKIISLLLAEGADVDIENEVGDTALLIASKTTSDQVISILLGNGADVNHRNKVGNTPLHLAANTYYNNTDIMQILIDNGADVDLVYNEGKRIICIANMKRDTANNEGKPTIYIANIKRDTANNKLLLKYRKSSSY